MAKSSRSNSRKKLRTQRREQVVKQTGWLATADEKRQAALAACIAAEPLETQGPVATEDTMEIVDKPKLVRVKKTAKPLKGAVMKKGGKRQVSVLGGKNQFYKKGKKGNR